ncbi:hypothetical protein IAD21_00271 [Abditibacteriota bacterium]|nr:hypothetical protein IAD21_00271 [Abditibacteriota bacterium]
MWEAVLFHASTRILVVMLAWFRSPIIDGKYLKKREDGDFTRRNVKSIRAGGGLESVQEIEEEAVEEETL